VRETVLDIEIIGPDPLDGHRAVEIGAVKLVNRSPTRTTFHCYLIPNASGCPAPMSGES
jgi:DNA polymerase III subunit epsilon